MVKLIRGQKAAVWALVHEATNGELRRRQPMTKPERAALWPMKGMMTPFRQWALREAKIGEWTRAEIRAMAPADLLERWRNILANSVDPV